MRENIIYRKKNCGWANKAAGLLEEKGIPFEEHIFSSKEEEDACKDEHGVSTTPIIFLAGRKVGGYTDLLEELGEEVSVEESKIEKSYAPIIAVFFVAVVLTSATGYGFMGFMGYFLSLLACLKMMDFAAFIEGFRQYDLLAQKLRVYAKVYPVLELLLAACVLSGKFHFIGGLLSLGVGAVGAYSVYQSVYVKKEDLSCACVGGNFGVPLGFISLVENVMMILMGIVLIF